MIGGPTHTITAAELRATARVIELETHVERLLHHIHSIDHTHGGKGRCVRCGALRRGLPDTPKGWKAIRDAENENEAPK